MRVDKHSRLSLARSLKLHQLAVFEKVTEAGSIVAASRELAMTQPAVSKSIHELERQLGEPLFARSHRGVTLTEFGVTFAQHAKPVLAELRYLAQGLNAWHSGTSGHVIVGTLLTASTTLLPDAILLLQRQAPDVSIEVRVGSNATLFPALARGELDIVIGFLPSDSEPALLPDVRARLSHVTLYDEALCVVVARDHPIRRKRNPVLADLAEMQWILPTPDSVAYGTALAMFEQAGVPLPRRVVLSVSVLTNISLLSRSTMAALMPLSAVTAFEQAGLVAVLPMGTLGVFGTVGCTLRADRPPSAVLGHLMSALREAAPTSASAGRVGAAAQQVYKPPHHIRRHA